MELVKINIYQKCTTCNRTYYLDKFINRNERKGSKNYTKTCLSCRDNDKNSTRKRNIISKCSKCSFTLDKFELCEKCRKEKWKSIHNFSDYKISNYGRIKNIKNNLLFSDTSEKFKKYNSYIRYNLKNDEDIYFLLCYYTD